jgi:NlpC/P60 family
MRAMVAASVLVLTMGLGTGACALLVAGSGDPSTMVVSAHPVGPLMLSATELDADSVAVERCPGLQPAVLAALLDVAAGTAGARNPGALVDQLCTAGARVSLPRALGSMGLPSGQIASVLILATALELDPSLPAPAGRALLFASAQLGVPYLWGGTGAGGFDCSGLVQAAYRVGGVGLPRVAQDQFDAGPPVVGPAEPGDLVFFGAGPDAVDHVGLYLGDNEMIDAPHTGAFVRIEQVDQADLVGMTRPG